MIDILQICCAAFNCDLCLDYDFIATNSNYIKIYVGTIKESIITTYEGLSITRIGNGRKGMEKGEGGKILLRYYLY